MSIRKPESEPFLPSEEAIVALFAQAKAEHLTEETLDRLLASSLGDAERQIIRAHCATCDLCGPIYDSLCNVTPLPDWYQRLVTQWETKGVSLQPLLFLDALADLNIPEGTVSASDYRRIQVGVDSSALDAYEDGKVRYGVRLDTDGVHVYYQTKDKMQEGKTVEVTAITPNLKNPSGEYVNFQKALRIKFQMDLSYGFDEVIRDLSGPFNEYSRLIFTSPYLLQEEAASIPNKPPDRTVRTVRFPSLASLKEAFKLPRLNVVRGFTGKQTGTPGKGAGISVKEGIFLDGIDWKILYFPDTGDLELTMETTQEHFYGSQIQAVITNAEATYATVQIKLRKRPDGRYLASRPIGSHPGNDAKMDIQLTLMTEGSDNDEPRGTAS